MGLPPPTAAAVSATRDAVRRGGRLAGPRARRARGWPGKAGGLQLLPPKESIVPRVFPTLATCAWCKNRGDGHV